jgi:very-short-patch-repair endonuclease
MTPGDIPDPIRKSRVATVAEWADEGISRQRLRSLIRSGDLVRTRYGVYATRAAIGRAAENRRLAHALAVKSALLCVGADAAASHQSAALILGLELLNDPPQGQVTLTRPDARKRNRGVEADVAFRAGALPPQHVIQWRTIPVTSTPRTVVDLARTLPYIDAIVVTDSALRKYGFARSRYEAMAAWCARWPGAGQARKVIEFADPAAGSVLESCLRVRLAEWGFPPPETQVPIDTERVTYDVDFLYREQRVIIEADGMAKFREKKDLDRHYQRRQALEDAGYTMVHVTWHELFGAPEVVIRRIRRALAPRGTAHEQLGMADG